MALLVDLDSHPPDFLAGAGAGAGADWAEVTGLSVPETEAEAGAEVEATLEAELIGRL